MFIYSFSFSIFYVIFVTIRSLCPVVFLTTITHQQKLIFFRAIFDCAQNVLVFLRYGMYPMLDACRRKWAFSGFDLLRSFASSWLVWEKRKRQLRFSSNQGKKQLPTYPSLSFNYTLLFFFCSCWFFPLQRFLWSSVVRLSV